MNNFLLPDGYGQILDGLREHSLSIVVPMYNEAENVEPLLDRMHSALGAYPWPWEVVLVDDGSVDHTASELARCAHKFGPHVRVVELVRNFKQTAAIQAGLDASRGSVIITMDGDLQNDPMDIPRLVHRLLNENLDLVAGWRKQRKDDLILRKIPSRIANRLIAPITGVQLRDYGCTLKAFRADAIKNVRLYGEMHRFIPAWLATVTTSRRIAQEVVYPPRACLWALQLWNLARVSRGPRPHLRLFFYSVPYTPRPFLRWHWRRTRCRGWSDSGLPRIRQTRVRRLDWTSAPAACWLFSSHSWSTNDYIGRASRVAGSDLP
jgi:glycosyltransferase involved in cell wall biosynthesis